MELQNDVLLMIWLEDAYTTGTDIRYALIKMTYIFFQENTFDDVACNYNFGIFSSVR